MEQVIEQNPRNSDALNFVAYAYAEQGRDLHKAEQLVQKALENKPGDGYYLDTLGFIQFKRGDIKQAEETLARAVAGTGQDPVIIEHYVDVLLAQGKDRQAVGLLKSMSDFELVGDDIRDRDKIEALKRLQHKLKELLKRSPELSAVDKTRFLKPVAQQNALLGVELLESEKPRTNLKVSK
jgi:tetratricopeptide (TPR) repeat protein